MHRHTVLFNLKDELNDADRDNVIAAIRSLGDLPTVDAFVVQKNILTKNEMAPYEWLMVGDFADEKAREAYEKHDTHVDVVHNKFLPNISGFIMADINY